MKGAILSLAPEAEVVDICHSVQAFDILDGALTLAQAYSYFPVRTVHVVVVDPGVGSARRPILASSERQNFVAPDNGVLSLIYAREERLSVRHITSEHYFLHPLSNTFHGRDIFAPVAAYLAKGVDHEKFGDEITDFVRFNAPRPKVIDPKTIRGVNHFRPGGIKANEVGDFVAEFLMINPLGEIRRYRRKNVAAMKGIAQGVQEIMFRSYMANAQPFFTGIDERQHAVVRRNKVLSL